MAKDEINLDYKYYDDLLERPASGGIEIKRDINLLTNELFEYNKTEVNKITDSIFDIDMEVHIRQRMKRERLPYDELEGEYYYTFPETPFVVSEKLHNAVVNMLPANDDFSDLQIGTLSWAIVKIGLHYRNEVLPSEEFAEEGYEKKAERARANIKFMNYLENYNKVFTKGTIWEGNVKKNDGSDEDDDSDKYYVPEKDISKVVIHYGDSTSGTVQMPVEWFELYIHTFRQYFNKDSDMKVNGFYAKKKNEYKNYLQTFSRSETKKKMIITEYAYTLFDLLKELKVSPVNQRYIVIGQIFVLLKIYRGQVGIASQTNADRIRKLMERKNKVAIKSKKKLKQKKKNR